MRSETEMMYQILQTAREDDRIRAVILNGSRVNPNIEPDIFQDYDIIYVVTDVAPFYNNTEWIKRFGEMMIMQMPDLMEDPPVDTTRRFAYLMQFADGNRIDLTIYAADRLDELKEDSLSITLLDKDGILAPFPEPSEASYLPKPPTAEEFAHSVNEFWWVCPYAAKGLWRKEMLYARQTIDVYLRKQLMQMLTWYVGTRTDFKVNVGKAGSRFETLLPEEMWDLLMQTYAGAEYGETWDALIAMTKLFRMAAKPVAEHFGFVYHHEEDDKVSAHLRHVRQLPADAEEMYQE